MGKPTLDPFSAAAWLKDSYDLLSKLEHDLSRRQVTTRKPRALKIENRVTPKRSNRVA
jgi:hypothetical protein